MVKVFCGNIRFQQTVLTVGLTSSKKPKTMKKAIVISLVALLLNSGTALAQTKTPKDFSAAYEGYISKSLEKIPDIPAVAVIVIKDDKPIFVRAYGMADKEAGIKADTDTL